jgi:hypothetical protein
VRPCRAYGARDENATRKDEPMKKKMQGNAKLQLNRESIQLLDGGLESVKGLSGEDCSIGTVCITCHITTK